MTSKLTALHIKPNYNSQTLYCISASSSNSIIAFTFWHASAGITNALWHLILKCNLHFAKLKTKRWHVVKILPVNATDLDLAMASLHNQMCARASSHRDNPLPQVSALRPAPSVLPPWPLTAMILLPCRGYPNHSCRSAVILLSSCNTLSFRSFSERSPYTRREEQCYLPVGCCGPWVLLIKNGALSCDSSPDVVVFP